MTPEDELIFALLNRLSKRYGIEPEDIQHMAKILAQEGIDPLPTADLGPDWRFDQPKLLVFDDCDFTHVNVVPPPNAAVSLLRAWQEFITDQRTATEVHASGRELTLEQSWRLFINAWDWERFWSVRHPNSETRKLFEQSYRESCAEGERLEERAKAQMRKQGVQVLRAPRWPN